MEIYTIEALLLVFLILITCAVIFCKDILSAAIIYSAFSFCAVLLYLMMGSPDVAFTEAVIGTISTIFFVASLKKIRGFVERNSLLRSSLLRLNRGGGGLGEIVDNFFGGIGLRCEKKLLTLGCNFFTF